MHAEGLGGAVDYPAAIALYEKAIALGNSYAMSNRAVLHQQGLGGAVDYITAIALYEKAIALGNINAMYNRALLHQAGMGGAVDDLAVINLLDQATYLGMKESIAPLQSLLNKLKLEKKAALLSNLWTSVVTGHRHLSNVTLNFYKSNQLCFDRLKQLHYDDVPILSKALSNQHPLGRLFTNSDKEKILSRLLDLKKQINTFNRSKAVNQGQALPANKLEHPIYSSFWRHGCYEPKINLLIFSFLCKLPPKPTHEMKEAEALIALYEQKQKQKHGCVIM
jgi:hypothetical protein